MRRLNLTLATCFIAFVTSLAQEITITKDTLDEKEANKKYKYQSFDQYDQQFLLKLGAQGGFAFSPGSRLRDIPFDLIALEFRLSRSISLEGTYLFPAQNFSAFSFRLRHYFKKGRLANNMSGRYISFAYINRMIQSVTFDESFQFQYGRQIKKSQFGYADFGLFSSYNLNAFENSLNFGLNVTVGAAWGPVGKRSNLELPSDSKFSSHREHFLVTLENPRFVIGDGFQSYFVATTLEKELFIEGLTLRTTMGGGFSRQNGSDEFFSRSTAFQVSGGVRKYFGLFKKPSGEDPIHSFVGLYLGAGVNNLYTYFDLEYTSPLDEEDISRYGFDRAIPFLTLGYQERIGKRYFFDIFANYSFYTYTHFLRNERGGPFLSFGTRVGLNWGR